MTDELKQAAQEKTDAFVDAVTSDKRWQLEDELMCQVLGFTLYGYVFGYGRIVCFMDVDDIKEMAASKLASLGIGPKYAQGMMDHAHQEFITEGNTSIHNQLIGVGHSHFGSEDLSELVDSIFANSEQIRQLQK